MSVPKCHKKAYLYLQFLQEKLKTNYDFDIRGFTPQELRDHPKANFLVGPTARGREDAESFSIHIHRSVGKMEEEELFSSMLHELLHTIFWPVVDCHNTALREVHSKVMKHHLDGEMFDAREQGTYRLERCLAPILWKEFLIDTEKKLSDSILPSPSKRAEGVEKNGHEEEGSTDRRDTEIPDKSPSPVQGPVQSSQQEAERKDAGVV